MSWTMAPAPSLSLVYKVCVGLKKLVVGPLWVSSHQHGRDTLKTRVCASDTPLSRNLLCHSTAREMSNALIFISIALDFICIPKLLINELCKLMSRGIPAPPDSGVELCPVVCYVQSEKARFDPILWRITILCIGTALNNWISIYDNTSCVSSVGGKITFVTQFGDQGNILRAIPTLLMLIVQLQRIISTDFNPNGRML
jgi:hypothetical protein